MIWHEFKFMRERKFELHITRDLEVHELQQRVESLLVTELSQNEADLEVVQTFAQVDP